MELAHSREEQRQWSEMGKFQRGLNVQSVELADGLAVG